MYEERLGTDWEDISGDEAIRRAYALGVAAAFGYENDDEFERLHGALDTSYDRSVVDLAYQKGAREAEVADAEDDAAGSDAVWTRLVDGSAPDPADGDSDVGEDAAGPTERPFGATDLPSSLGRAGLLEGGADLPAIDIPGLFGGSSARGDDPEGEG